MIIHLGALIYPLPVALNVGPFCEPALRIRNEPMAQSVSSSKGAYLYPYSSAGHMRAHMRYFLTENHEKPSNAMKELVVVVGKNTQKAKNNSKHCAANELFSQLKRSAHT